MFHAQPITIDVIAKRGAHLALPSIATRSKVKRGNSAIEKSRLVNYPHEADETCLHLPPTRGAVKSGS